MRRPGTAAFAVLLLVLLAFGSATAADPFLRMSVAGNRVVDPYGRSWVFKGVNMYDPCLDYLPETYYQAAAACGSRLVRLPVHPRSITDKGGIDQALAMVETAVAKAAKYGMYAIIDFHSIGSLAPGYVNFQQDGYGSYDTTQAQYDEFWRKTAQRYHGDNRVAFYELWNEPIIDGWQPTEADAKAQRDWFQAQINMIRQYDPDKILLIGALDWCYQHQLAKAWPYVGTNLAYAVHPYPNQDLPWDAYWGFLAAQAPVLATEWGWTASDANLSESAYLERSGGGSYRRDLVAYLSANGIGYTAWSFTAWWAPAMLADESGFSLTEFGAFVRDDMRAQSYPAAVGTPPTISGIANRTISEDATTGAIAFTVGDAETSPGALTLQAASSNTGLVPVANVVFGGSGASRTVAVTPAANANGSATITVTVSDAGGLRTSASFQVTVTAVNDVPTIAGLAARTTVPGAAIQVPLAIGDIDSPVDSLILTATSSANGVVPASGLAFSGTGANRTLTVTPAMATGTSTITVRVSDGSAQASTSFVVTVAGPQVGSGTGLAATYYSQPGFTGRAVQRVDQVIDFNWGIAAPASGIGADNWCVRWTGEVQAQYSQIYAFSATADDGVRLWVDGRLLIDAWKAQAATESTASITLNAGQRYEVVVEYYERTGNAVARLAWSSPSTPKQVIPRSQLYPLALPTAWKAQDVGSVVAPGSTSAGNGIFTVTGSGADIWGTADAFQFASTTLTGDGVITARVASMQATDPWAKAGVMLRESTAAGSRHALCCVTPGNGIEFQRRTATGGASAHTAGPDGGAPRWVRLTRAGTTITAGTSEDGVAWTTIGSATISLSSQVLVGLAVSSHAAGTLCTAVFDHVTVVPGGSG